MEKVAEVAARMRASRERGAADCAELCELAGMRAEWEAANGATFEGVVIAAAEKLGVKIC